MGLRTAARRLTVAVALVLAGAGSLPAADVDGAGADLLLYRAGLWTWFDYATGNPLRSVVTGTDPSCIVAVGDYDGDEDTELSQLCSGAWHFYDTDGNYIKGIWTGAPSTAQPVPADYDGDGVTDVALFNDGAWIFFDFATGAYDAARSRWTGGIGKAAPMDFDGDGTADFSLYAGGALHFFNDDGSYANGIWIGIPGPNDPYPNIPVPHNRDADVAEEAAIFHINVWHFYDYDTATYQGGVIAGAFELNTRPTPVDADGNGSIELAAYEIVGGSAQWKFFDSSGAFIKTILTGAPNNDQPISRRHLP